MSGLNTREMTKVLKALANPTRLRMIALISEEPKNIYALAKELNLPYPLAHLHLGALKKLGLVKEVREERKVEGMPSVKYYAPSNFHLVLTPQSIRDAVQKRDRGEGNG